MFRTISSGAKSVQKLDEIGLNDDVNNTQNNSHGRGDELIKEVKETEKTITPMNNASKKQLERTNRDEETIKEKDEKSAILDLQKNDDLMEEKKGKSELGDVKIQDDDVNK